MGSLTNFISLTLLLLAGLGAAFISPVQGWSSSGPSWSHNQHQPTLTGGASGEAYDTTIELLLHYTNAERSQFQLNQLRFDSQLSKAAQRHAVCMARNCYFSHTGHTGSNLGDRVKLTDYRYTAIGENLFMRQPDNSPAAAVAGWMMSAGHRENLLNPKFSEVGFGYCPASGDTHYYVQVFGHPLGTPSVHGEGNTRETLFLLTNQARSKANLHYLSMSNELNAAAQKHADEMARRGSFSSNDALPRPENYQYSLLAANFAHREPFNDPHGAVEAWLEKPDSYLLDGQFTDTGIGYAVAGERNYYVQLFGTPARRGGPTTTEVRLLGGGGGIRRLF